MGFQAEKTNCDPRQGGVDKNGIKTLINQATTGNQKFEFKNQNS
jgi:hypothetical protein